MLIPTFLKQPCMKFVSKLVRIQFVIIFRMIFIIAWEPLQNLKDLEQLRVPQLLDVRIYGSLL